MGRELIFKEEHNKIRFCCIKCGRCCENSRIRISPYDILRICERLNISTEEFHQNYSLLIKDKENAGLLTCLLKTKPKCVFWGEGEGCRIYLDRPLGCRVFPLGSQAFFDGEKLDIKYYVLEKCPGFGTGKKMTIRDFKDKEEITEEKEWVKFKAGMINVPWPREEWFYEKFFQMCYNFDSIFFKEMLKVKRVGEEKEWRNRNQQIIRIAREKLLKPYQNG